jgi:antitoxin component YwqK of YwqJK toxin-antitoxin module
MWSKKDEIKEVVSRDDQNRIREKRFIRNGKPEGEYVSYFVNGQIMALLNRFLPRKRQDQGKMLF